MPELCKSIEVAKKKSDIKVFYAVVNKSRVDLIRSRASNQVRDKTRSTVGKIAYWHKNFLPRKTLNYI